MHSWTASAEEIRQKIRKVTCAIFRQGQTLGDRIETLDVNMHSMCICICICTVSNTTPFVPFVPSNGLNDTPSRTHTVWADTFLLKTVSRYLICPQLHLSSNQSCQPE